MDERGIIPPLPRFVHIEPVAYEKPRCRTFPVRRTRLGNRVRAGVGAFWQEASKAVGPAFGVLPVFVSRILLAYGLARMRGNLAEPCARAVCDMHHGRF